MTIARNQMSNPKIIEIAEAKSALLGWGGGTGRGFVIVFGGGGGGGGGTSGRGFSRVRTLSRTWGARVGMIRKKMFGVSEYVVLSARSVKGKALEG